MIMARYGGDCAGPPAPHRDLPIFDRTGDGEGQAFVVPVVAGYLRMIDVVMPDHFNVIVFADGGVLPETLFNNPRERATLGEERTLLARDGKEVCITPPRINAKKRKSLKYCIDAARFDTARKIITGTEPADKAHTAFLQMLFLGIEIKWTSLHSSMGVVLHHKMFDEKKVDVTVDGRKRTLTFTNAPVDRWHEKGEDLLDIAISENGTYILELIFGEAIERYEIDVKSWPIAVNAPFETTPRFSCLTWARAGVISPEGCPNYGTAPL